MTSVRNHAAQSRPSPRSADESAVGVIGEGREHAAQLSAASAVLQRSLERLANLSDVRLLVSEVLTSIIEVAGADGGALLRYVPTTHTLVLQSYVLDGLVLDIANNERLAQKQEVMFVALLDPSRMPNRTTSAFAYRGSVQDGDRFTIR